MNISKYKEGKMSNKTVQGHFSKYEQKPQLFELSKLLGFERDLFF